MNDDHNDNKAVDLVVFLNKSEKNVSGDSTLGIEHIRLLLGPSQPA